MIAAILKLLARLPRRWLQALGSALGHLGSLVGTRAAKVGATNLALCYPDLPSAELQALAKQSMVETSKTFLETPALWFGKMASLNKWIAQVHGEPLLTDALNSGKGLLLLMPHTGNWELLNAFYRRYGRLTALYQPPRQPSLRPLMAQVREVHGHDTVPTDASGIRQLYRVLGAGGTVAVLPDQVPQQGRYASFFGQLALTDELSCRLARKTGATALGICFIRLPDGRFDVHLLPVAGLQGELEAGVLAINQLVERVVSLAPAQYLWEYKRFRQRPAGEPELYHFG